MSLPSEMEILRVFVGELDKDDHRPLYETIVEKAHRRGLTGATVLRGIMGFGSTGHLHQPRILRLLEDVPVVIEIVDRPELIAEFLVDLGEMMSGGLVTIQKVEARSYRHGTPKNDEADGDGSEKATQ
jgi:uncharacterized protein